MRMYRVVAIAMNGTKEDRRSLLDELERRVNREEEKAPIVVSSQAELDALLNRRR